jgi:hypothetical protein
MKMKYTLLAIMLFSLAATNAQVQRDQDLVTLKNGTQYLGYIIEQKPGKHIKIFRPTVNDTVMAKMEDIDKLSKILIQSFSEKKIDSIDTIIETGRYNNKKNVFQFSFASNYCEFYGDNFIKGVSMAYYKNYNNRFYVGIGTTIFMNQKNEKLIYDKTLVHSVSLKKNIQQFHLLLENKLRLSRNYQNKRLTTLLGINAGYVFEKTSAEYPYSPLYKTNSVQYEENKGNFILQTSLALKVNPDNNSGFIIEPGYAFYSPVVKQYNMRLNDASSSAIGNYLGYRKEACHLFTFRLSYFF